MAYVITQPCIGTKDASCVEVCPVDCIHSRDDAEQYFINPDECIDCGVCAEVCPVEAITFGDMNDPQSRVTRLKRSPLNYWMLGELNTQPRTSYLAKLRNVNSEIKA